MVMTGCLADKGRLASERLSPSRLMMTGAMRAAMCRVDDGKGARFVDVDVDVWDFPRPFYGRQVIEKRWTVYDE